VLSAVEGVKLVAPQLSSWIVPITVVIIVGLFGCKVRHGQDFHRLRPIMAIWFLTLGVSGLIHIVSAPAVLWRSIRPMASVF